MKFFKELKRRNVIKETIAYIVVAWVFLQVTTMVLAIFEAPSWVSKTLIFIIAMGLPVWIFFSWAYQVTPEGFKKTEKISEDQPNIVVSNKRLDILIVISLMVAIAVTFINKPTNNLASQTIVTNDLALNNSIAVLPFLDMSPNKDQEFYSDGIAVDILNELCKFRELKVVGRTSSFSFKNKNEDIKSIGDKLDVNNILEGSVRRQGNKIMISVRLTNAENGFTIFSESYSDELENIFALQSAIAIDIAEKIESNLVFKDNQLRPRKKVNPLAYEIYLKGKLQFVNGPLNMQVKEIINAKKYFEAAVKMDSSFAEANAYLSLAYFNLVDWAIPYSNTVKRNIALDSAKLLAIRAHSIDSLSSGAHLAMGSYYFHEYNWVQAEIEKRKAVKLNPGGAEEKFILASFLGQFGQAEEALRLDEEALKLDPLDINSKIKYARDLYRARQYDKGIEQCNLILKEEPNSAGALQFKYLCYSGKKQFQEAGKNWAKFLELKGDNKFAEIFKTFEYKTAIKKELLYIKDSISPGVIPPIKMSIWYAELEDKDNLFKYLDLLYEKGLPQISYLSQHQFDFIRDDPRYLDLYKKAGFKAYYEAKKTIHDK